MVDIKVNHCPDVVSTRDIEIMEMLEYTRLIRQLTDIKYKLHGCSFTTATLDAWSRGMTKDELFNYYKENR